MKIIAEIGINHRGDVDVARELVDIAVEAGAWGVKFQYRAKEKFYDSVSEIGDEIINDELKRSYLAPEVILDLCAGARERGVAGGVSFFRYADAADFGDRLGEFDFFKVPSAELLNAELVEPMAALGKTLILSTGGHSQPDIGEAVARMRANDNVVFMHCISNYPVLLGNQQMAFIRTLKEMVGGEVGYSTHDQDWEVSLVAAANGATWFERHLTLDKKGSGLDDSSSSDPTEFRRLCRILKAFSAIDGDGSRRVNQGELINMQNLGSSLYATTNIAIGDIVSSENTILRAPRKGLTRVQLERLETASVLRPVSAGEPLTRLHFIPPTGRLEKELSAFCDDLDLSLPVRLHDSQVLQDRFPIRHFELHLSYGEVSVFDRSPETFLDQIDLSRIYSIHLPDYLPGNRLIDPLSTDGDIRRDSVAMIDTCVALAKRLVAETGDEVPIVGSFSRLQPDGKRPTMRRLHDYLGGIKQGSGIEIMPQWLPRIAWYFGGAEILDMFCGADDVELVQEHDMKICLDISHLILSANHDKADWRQWSEQLMPLAGHLHVADAEGVDGEGIEFGKGNLGNVNRFLQAPQRKVLEVWQGHLENGEGFDQAIRHLYANWGEE